uniref:Reelin domain-containing protein n=1 Tax=Castor canadensis TaxID=51338 RepID=A0A8C0W5W5_CASCN
MFIQKPSFCDPTVLFLGHQSPLLDLLHSVGRGRRVKVEDLGESVGVSLSIHASHWQNLGIRGSNCNRTGRGGLTEFLQEKGKIFWRTHVTLSAAPPSYFRGFTLIALKENREGDKEEDHAGTFQIIDEEETQFMSNCPVAVTESTPRRRTRIQVFWMAPPAGTGCVILK